MKTTCEIVRDLLPLYVDDVCSPASRGLVEEHLEQCSDCKGISAGSETERPSRCSRRKRTR